MDNTQVSEPSTPPKSKFESEESKLIQEINEERIEMPTNEMPNNLLDESSTSSSSEEEPASNNLKVENQTEEAHESSELLETAESKPEEREASSSVHEEEKKDEAIPVGAPSDEEGNEDPDCENIEVKPLVSTPSQEFNVSPKKSSLTRRKSNGDGNILPVYDNLISMMKKASSRSSSCERNSQGDIVGTDNQQAEPPVVVSNPQLNENDEDKPSTNVITNANKRIESPSTDEGSDIQMNLSKTCVSEVNSCVSDENSDDQRMNQTVQRKEIPVSPNKRKRRSISGTPRSNLSAGSSKDNQSISRSIAQDSVEIPVKPVHSSTSFASLDQNGQILFMPNQPIMMPQLQAPMQVNYLHQPLGVPPSAFSQTPPLQQVSPAYNGTPMKTTVVQNQTQPMRRKMELALVEERRIMHDESEKKSLFSIIGRQKSTNSSIGRQKSISSSVGGDDDVLSPDSKGYNLSIIDHGVITVSWFEGTTTIELEEHVLKAVQRKLELGSKRIIKNIRLLDDSFDTPEEIVLSPYIPSGSKYVLKFHIKDMRQSKFFPSSPFQHRAPDSPSKAPSPPLGSENAELEELHKQINDVLTSSKVLNKGPPMPSLKLPDINDSSANDKKSLSTQTRSQKQPHNDGSSGDNTTKSRTIMNGSHDVLASRLEKLSDALLRVEDIPMWERNDQPAQKSQVIFMIANYFVLFLSIIAISAEVHERAPRWLDWVNENITTVQNCAADRDALFECVSQGNFSGLLASIIIWASQSVATKRLFLFGFDSPAKLWIVVYEAGVTAICWGTSYLLIRRGLNPDNRPNVLQKYWKDAVYGSLAGFNAAFMKAVLKNLIPQDQMLDVLETRQIKILKFLGSAFKDKAS